MIGGQITLQAGGMVIGPFDVWFAVMPNELTGWKYRGEHLKGYVSTSKESKFYFTGWKPKSKMIFTLKDPQRVPWLKAALVLQEDYQITQFKFYGETDPF